MKKNERDIRNAILAADKIRVLQEEQLKAIVGGMPRACTGTCGEAHSQLSTCTKINTSTDPLSA